MSSGRPVTTTVAAGVSALRSEIDHVVRRLDHIEMMLNQQHGVTGVHEPVQRLEQPLHVSQVETGRRLIEDVQGVL